MVHHVVSAFGAVSRPTPGRAELLARFRPGQLVEVIDDICDRYAEDPEHQLRVRGGTTVLITSVAGHSGDEARYRFVLLDELRRPTPWWNVALGSNLTEAAQPPTLRERLAARLRGMRW